MTNKQRTRAESSKSQAMNAALTQIAESERAELLDNIERLQAVLYRYIPLLDSESIEVVTQTQAALENIRVKINRIFAIQTTCNSREQGQNWENEGGRIAFVPG